MSGPNLDSTNVTIVIDMDKKCVECGKGGALPTELCLRCTKKAIENKRPMKTWQGRGMRERWNAGRRK